MLQRSSAHALVYSSAWELRRPSAQVLERWSNQALELSSKTRHDSKNQWILQENVMTQKYRCFQLFLVTSTSMRKKIGSIWHFLSQRLREQNSDLKVCFIVILTKVSECVCFSIYHARIQIKPLLLQVKLTLSTTCQLQQNTAVLMANWSILYPRTVLAHRIKYKQFDTTFSVKFSLLFLGFV